MANRLLLQIENTTTRPKSWNDLVNVMKYTVDQQQQVHVGFEDEVHNYGEARRRALRWLSREDTSSLSNIPQHEYEEGLLQRYALATIYFATGGDVDDNSSSGITTNWNRCSQNKQTICESDKERYLSPYSHLNWDGINGKNGYVTWLDLSGRDLQSSNNDGTSSNKYLNFLPMELTLLSPSLELLWLHENTSLYGTIPQYIGEFKSLLSLSLYKTSLSGTIPESLYELPKLTSLRMYKSNFGGSISSSVSKLSELKWLWIHENRFEGVLPGESLGMLKSLEGVTLHGNQFDASASSEGLAGNIIPSSLCNLKENGNLKHLWTDCEKGSVVPADAEDGTSKSELVVKEGVKACSCCTKCFPTE